MNITMLSIDQFHSQLLEMSWNIDHWDAMIRNVWLINDLNRNTVFCLRNLKELIEELIKANWCCCIFLLELSKAHYTVNYLIRSMRSMYKILLILIQPVTVNNSSGTSIVTGLNLRPYLISSEGLLWNNRINMMCGTSLLLEDLHQMIESLGSTGGIRPWSHLHSVHGGMRDMVQGWI